jgi:hypothetical protein
MAKYQILRWKDLPSQVRAFDDQSEAKAVLPEAFQEAIDRAALKAGEHDAEAYLEGWNWSEVEEMPGSPQQVLDAVLARFSSEPEQK